MLKIPFFALGLLLLPPASSDEPLCRLATVAWRDAAVHVRQSLGDIDSMTADVLTAGCVTQTPKTVLVIISITEGKPDIFLAIPHDWVQTITPLKKTDE